MSLGKQTLRSSIWNFAGNAGQQLMQFAFFIFMARLLEPKAFGLVAMALVSVDLLTIIAKCGLLETLVQRKDENEALTNRVFWILQGIGVALTAMLIVCAGLIANAFDTPELKNVIIGFSVLIGLYNLTVVHEARLRRRFLFKNLATRTLAGTLIGSSCGLVFALMGMGVVSLVLQRLAMVIIQIGILWSADSWRPRFNFKNDDKTESVSVLFKMGSTLMIGQLMGVINTRMIDVLVGFFMGPVALGYLRIAWRIFDFILQFAVYPVTRVVLTTFSKLNGQTERVKRAYLRMVEITALTTFPAFAGLTAVAGLAVPLLFGERWIASVPLMQGLSVMAVAAIVNVFFGPVMTSQGHARLILQQSTLQLGITLVLTAIASQWSLIAVVLAHAARALIIALLNLRLQSKYAGIGVRETLVVMWKPLSVALLMGATVWGLEKVVVTEGFSRWFELAGLVAMGAAMYGGLMTLLFRKHLLSLIKDTLQMLRKDGKKAPIDTPVPL